MGIYDKGTTHGNICGIPSIVLKAGTYSSILTLPQDNSNKLKYTLTGLSKGADIKRYEPEITISYPLYPNLSLDVKFVVEIECFISQIKPEFAPTPFYYYANVGGTATSVEIDLSTTVYNQVPLCRFETYDKFTVTIPGTASGFTTLDIQRPKITVSTANGSHVSSTPYAITVANSVTVLTKA